MQCDDLLKGVAVGVEADRAKDSLKPVGRIDGVLQARVRELVEFARRHGCRRDELVDLIRAV